MKQSRLLILGTAFFEGLNVLVVEIAGARALAPFFGSSLNVWTAQITATLLFLALGYAFGGFLSRRTGTWRLPAMFWTAGLWLALFPLLRAPVLGMSASLFGVAFGSFLSSSILFGLPLLCLGAVSPILISFLDAEGGKSGEAAGKVFFTNTLGGLAGGWLTAQVLISHLPLRRTLASCGLFLIVVGSFWGLWLKRSLFASGATPLVAIFLLLTAPRPVYSFKLNGVPVRIVDSVASSSGLIQVFDLGVTGRSLVIDGVTQGGIDKQSGASIYEFTAYQDFLSHRFHPHAKNALLLGLGSGVLARLLSGRGLEVSAAEIEPRVAEVARRWFGLPESVRVITQDGRAYLRSTSGKYDLIFLDAFTGESPPWYLSTLEALESMRAHLNPGGLLIVNTITWGQHRGSAGIARLETGLLKVFDQVKVFTEYSADSEKLVNSIVVAGEALKPGSETFKGNVLKELEPKLGALLKEERPAQASARIALDDFSDLDYAEADLRAKWRKILLNAMGPKVLGD